MKETAMANAWYEVLSVLHLMAMLSLLQANRLLLPKISSEGYQLKISEGGKDLPLDLEEEVLRALCLQALGQCVDIQLGMAIDSPKATLAVKRRLAFYRLSTTWQSFLVQMAGLKSINFLLSGNMLKQSSICYLCRNPPLWGSMKYLSEKIPKDASSKIRINQDLYSEER
ncbi:hypothetical protein B296_00041466 [Ensete ventricosum]|uniref:Uncharacterized protein n=1 Tax=Ensete ventricosum TaxID=4639 RepID=A0A426Z9D6_ENSVE|nr:hypothetical protein B296_00041466 [Ensete ventricosum]